MSLYVASRLRAGELWRQPALVAAVSAPMLFATLGRCDPGHVVLNGIGVLLFVTALFSSAPRLWNLYRVAFLFCFILLPTLTLFLFYEKPLSRLPAARAWIQEAGTDSGDPAHHLALSSEAVEAPFGYQPAGFGSWRSARIDTGYFFGTENAFLPQSAELKVAELQRHPERDLLLPEPLDPQCQTNPATEAAIISVLFVYPYRSEPRHNDDLLLPLCDYIHQHYRPVQTARIGLDDYTLWAPK